MKYLLIIPLLFYSFLSTAQEMEIGVLRSYKLKKISMTVEKGVYDIYADTSFVLRLLEGESIQINYFNGRAQLIQSGADLRITSHIRLVPTIQHSIIKFTSITPSFKSRSYQDGFQVSCESSSIRVVNIVDMNNYLGGVIESEGGGGRNIEYYKVQALLSRTYALKNVQRHKKEGFQLCDGVHCQAYHNMLKHTPMIKEAVNATAGEVLVDANFDLITSYFAANCGGQTCEASYVWNTSVPYLESFKDTFCIHTRQATWEKRISKSDWDNYLNKEYGLNKLGIDLGNLRYDFKQEERKAFYIHPSLGIPLRDLRRKFNLKSTFFSSHLEGDEVILNGRGFGHGIGLCQEGAIEMANQGYSYKQIALYYFERIQVIDYYRSQFFRQEQKSE